MIQTNEKNTKHSIHKRVVSVLTVFVVFIITYSLLPLTVAIEQDVAESEPGIYLADIQVENDLVEESSEDQNLEDVVTNISGQLPWPEAETTTASLQDAVTQIRQELPGEKAETTGDAETPKEVLEEGPEGLDDLTENRRELQSDPAEPTDTEGEKETETEPKAGSMILNKTVSYTINYLDMNGNTLAPSETYYGNVGDTPVIEYLYIEGYQPSCYNITSTLNENAADIVFSFVYMPVTTGTQGAAENGAGTEAEAEEGAEGPGSREETAEGPETSAVSGGTQAGPENPTEIDERFTESEEILDNDVPTAVFDAGKRDDKVANLELSKPVLVSVTEASSSVFLPVLSAVVVIGLLMLIWLILLKRRKKKNT